MQQAIHRGNQLGVSHDGSHVRLRLVAVAQRTREAEVRHLRFELAHNASGGGPLALQLVQVAVTRLLVRFFQARQLSLRARQRLAQTRALPLVAGGRGLAGAQLGLLRPTKDDLESGATREKTKRAASRIRSLAWFLGVYLGLRYSLAM